MSTLVMRNRLEVSPNKVRDSSMSKLEEDSFQLDPLIMLEISNSKELRDIEMV